MQQVKQWRVSYYSQLWGRSLSCVTCVVGEARCAAAYYLHFFFFIKDQNGMNCQLSLGKGFNLSHLGFQFLLSPVE